MRADSDTTTNTIPKWLTGKRYYAALLLACVLAFLAIALPLFSQGKTIIWEFDGYGLYLNFFILEGELIRSAVSDIFAGTFSGISTYAFDAGYGADLLATTAGCFNDPFNLVSAVCPAAYAEYVYQALVFVRFYLAAVAFSLFCFRKRKSGVQVLVASLCYVTSGFVIFWAVTRHANFLNVAILLPLILLGAEKLFAKEKPFVLIGSLALSLLFSVYFSYMLILVLLGYCLIKFFCSFHDRTPRAFGVLVGKFIACIALSCLIAAAVLVPELLLLTSMGRVGLERADVFLQPLSYYVYLPLTFVGSPISANGAYLGCFPVVCVLVVLAFRKRLDRTEATPWLIGLAVCFIGILLPFFGKAMNGFSYVSDRWMVAWAFCAAYIVCLTVPLLMERRIVASGRFAAVIAIFVVLLALTALYRGGWDSYLACAMFLAVALVVVVLGSARLRQSIYAVCWSILIIASTFGAAFATFPPSSDGGSEFAEIGETAQRFENNPDSLLMDATTDEWRFSQPARYTFCNATLNSGVKGIEFYSSFYNQVVDDYRQELGLSDDNSNYRFVGSDSRTALEALAGARYFLASDVQSNRVPDAYEQIQDCDGYNIYESHHVLPLAFVYNSAISRETFDALNLVQKQETMLQSVVLEGWPDASSVDVEAHSTMEDVRIVDSSNIRVEDGQIIALKGEATITVEYDVSPSAEEYLCLSGLSFEPSNPYTAEYVNEAGGMASKVKRTVRGLMWNPPSTSKVTVSRDGFTRNFEIKTNAAKTYAGKTDWVVNLGSADSGTQRLTITFQRRGVYSFDSMSMAKQELQPLYGEIDGLNNNGAVDYSCVNNTVKAHSDKMSAGAYLYLSLPYSSGWSAELNGEPVEIEKANVGFMAVRAKADGAQDLVLTYETPGLMIGAAGTVAGLVVLLCYWLITMRRSVSGKRDKERL